jgi:hypothetical protein
MTEDEWLHTKSPSARLRFVARHGSDRKLRLFACACARRFFPLLAPPARQAVEVAEQFADGLVGDRQRAAAYASARRGTEDGRMATEVARDTLLWGAFQAALRVASWCAYGADGAAARAAEEATQLRLVDCVFGNPFRPPAARPFPVHVVGLARSVYAGFPAVSEDYPILADALEELGEAEAAAHCRAELHAKGCHVLDWITGNR